MPTLLLLLAAASAAFLAYRWLKATPPGKRPGAYLKLGLALLVTLVLALTVTGRMHWLGAAITGLAVGVGRLLPTLARLFPVLQWLYGRRAQAGAAGRRSTVATALLRMTLDHDSGDINGEVLAGEFKGASLDRLGREELERILDWCRQRDEDSRRLLESYLARRFGDFQAQPGGGEGAPQAGGRMSRAEALAILGLEEGASDEDVAGAHRRLMQKLHPDRGGSDYLAARINQAKDCLLG